LTPRERFIASVSGSGTDRKPSIGCKAQPDADAVVIPIEDLEQVSGKDQPVLVQVVNAYGRDPELKEVLATDPDAGNERLRSLCDEIRAEVEQALEDGADGVVYVVTGAEPDHCTPMEYGGHFLERDRELLQFCRERATTVVFIEGGPETYFDFVSDLPADVFAWDCRKSNVPPERIRSMRNGVLAAEHEDADIHLAVTFMRGRILNKEAV
jgi:hypothetical protein